MKKLKLNKEIISLFGMNQINGGRPSDDANSICVSGSCGTTCCPTMQIIGPNTSCEIKDSCGVKCVEM